MTAETVKTDSTATKKSPGTKGVVAVVVALTCAYAISMSNFKIAATISLLMQYFQVGPTVAGTAVTISGLVGLIVALFFGSAVTKWGPRKVGFISISCALIGTVIGALSDTIGMLLFSRVFEGFAFGTALTVVTPLISQWMPPEKRSIPMGFLGVWVGGGQFLITRTANLVFDGNDPSTWVNVWVFIGVLLAVCLILWLVFAHSPAPEDSYLKPVEGKQPKLREGFNNPLVWCAFLIFFFMSLALSSGVTFTQSYVTTALGGTPAMANDWASVRSLAAIAIGIFAGFALVKISSLKGRMAWIIASGVIILGAAAFTFAFTPSTAVPYMILAGLATGALAPAMFSIAPDISSSPMLTSVTMGFIMVGQNLGNICSGTLTGMLVQNLGYATTNMILGCYGAALLVVAIAMYVLVKKRYGDKFGAKAGDIA